MKILLVCMQYDYGDPDRGLSYEYNNCYLSLKDMGHDVTIFDYMEELRRHGRMEMNRHLQKTVIEYQPMYLKDEPQTDAVAKAGYRRTLEEHTFAIRFKSLFERIDFK